MFRLFAASKRLNDSAMRLPTLPDGPTSATLAGYEGVNDAERRRHDPAMICIVDGNATHGCGALNSYLSALLVRGTIFLIIGCS